MKGTDHSGQGWEPLMLTDTHYFYGLFPGVKSKERNYNCTTLGSFTDCVEKDECCVSWDAKARC